MSKFDVRDIHEQYLDKYHHDDFHEIISNLKKCVENRNIYIEGELELWTKNDLLVLETYLSSCGFKVYINYQSCESNNFRISIV